VNSKNAAWSGESLTGALSALKIMAGEVKPPNLEHPAQREADVPVLFAKIIFVFS
jgi:hypothetical protein